MIRVESKIEGRQRLAGWHDDTVAVRSRLRKVRVSEWVKTIGGQNSVRGSCGDETSRAKKDREKQVTKKGLATLYSWILGNKARNGPFGDDLCPNKGSLSIDAKTLLLMEIASAS